MPPAVCDTAKSTASFFYCRPVCDCQRRRVCIQQFGRAELILKLKTEPVFTLTLSFVCASADTIKTVLIAV